MHDIALLPGASHNASSMWPLQQLDDASLHPIDYERENFHRRTTRMPYVLQQYGVRVYEKLRALDKPVDLYAWSMGAPVSLAAVKIADRVAPGLIRNIVMITPGVFHGPPPRNFHRKLGYLGLLMYHGCKRYSRQSAALTTIRRQIPDFSHEIDEDYSAMLEAGDGVIRIPNGFDRSRIRFYYTPDDEIIPEKISLFVAERARLKANAITGYGHELPLLNTSGSVLEYIRKHET